MTNQLKRVTIHIDELAKEPFTLTDRNRRGYVGILEELQRNLQNLGDDPTYKVVILAADGQNRFIEIRDTNSFLAGVFPRISATLREYGPDNMGLRNILSIERDTIVVVDNERVAEMWKKELSSLDYQIRNL